MSFVSLFSLHFASPCFALRLCRLSASFVQFGAIRKADWKNQATGRMIVLSLLPLKIVEQASTLHFCIAHFMSVYSRPHLADKTTPVVVLSYIAANYNVAVGRSKAS